MANEAVILLSGGLDSMYALVRARGECHVRLGLTFDYGQRSRAREIKAAQRACEACDVPHRVITIPFFSELSSHPLLDERTACPDLRPEDLDDRAKTLETARAVWIPNRNGVFIAVAASAAEQIGARFLYTGFNAEEGASFPDNSAGFVESATQSLAYSTRNGVTVRAPAIGMTKADIVKECQAGCFDFGLVWSCYLGGERMCGRCESCRRLKRALAANGIKDGASFAS